jgi:hypothetical protein
MGIETVIKVNQIKTSVYGLKYEPRFSDSRLNDLDWFQEYDDYVQALRPELPLFYSPNVDGWPISFSMENGFILRDCIRNLGSQCNNIMEIGVSREHPYYSSTNVILTNMPSHCNYYGIDLRDCRYLFNKDNTKFLQCNSFAQERVRQFVPNQIDLLLIDGLHSINAFINDWKYADLVRPGGYVVFHDTSHHPGPRECFFAIDENLFDKSMHCVYDYGIGVAKKK